MSLSLQLGLCLLVSCALAQNSNFADYDYQDSFQSNNRQQSRPISRPQSPPSRPSYISGPTTPRPTPVPILKQINRHNDDGSYTYGFEGADGSFKIETKLANGEVMGKYGYVDESGKLRTVEYGANRYGFQPSGEGITVAPPTLVDETTRKGPNGEPLEYEEDGYFEQPLSRPKTSRPRPRPQPQSYNDDVYLAPAARQPSSFGPPPPSRPSYSSSGPVPHRASVAGSAPVPPRPSYSSSAPVPPRAIVAGAAPSGPTFRPAPPQSSYASRPAPVREAYRPSQRGLLDDLEKQFSLPRGNPTHDITFGSYSSQTSY